MGLQSARFTWRCLIASLICFWISLFCYVAYVNMGVNEDNGMETIMHVDIEHSEVNHINNIKQIQPKPLKIPQQKHHISSIIEIPNMLTISPPIKTNISFFKTICPLRQNICMKNKHWITPNKNDIFNAKPSIRYCEGIVCNSFYAEYDKSILNKCIMYDNLSIVLLGQYYPHMFPHIWSRTINGLWEYSIRSQIISMNHHFVYQQLDYFDLFMSHQLLIKPFSHHPIQHYKNLLLNPHLTLQHMNINSNNYSLVKDESELSDTDSNCGCIKEVYFCGFNTNFTQNYPQGFLTKRQDGNYFSWDRIEWFKQYWRDSYSKSISTTTQEIQFIEEYFGIDPNNKPIIGLIDKRKNGKWLNIENVVNDCGEQHEYYCKIIRTYEIEKPIELLWIMNKIDILIGFHSNSIVEGGLWLPYTSTIIEILPAKPLASWLDLPGSVLQWIFRKIPQRHAWFQLFENENYHKEAFDAGKSNFNFSFDELNKVVQFVIDLPNQFCYNDDHDTMPPLELKNRNFTFDIKEFDVDGVLYPHRPECKIK